MIIKIQKAYAGIVLSCNYYDNYNHDDGVPHCYWHCIVWLSFLGRSLSQHQQPAKITQSQEDVDEQDVCWADYGILVMIMLTLDTRAGWSWWWLCDNDGDHDDRGEDHGNAGY